MYLTCLFTTKSLHVQNRAQSLPSTQDAASLFTHKSPPPKRSPTSVRASEHSSRRSSVHVLSARRSHASDTRPAVRLPTSKTQKERGDALSLHGHSHHSASSEDCTGGDTRARQQATRQHLTGERCARVKRPLPTNGH